MPAIKHAVIAAAGIGSRLGYAIPKCLLDIAGRCLLESQLRLLRDVVDVRIVVGYRENDVMSAALRIREDIIFVRNPTFSTTTTQDSYALGCRDLVEGCLFMDADIWFEQSGFRQLLREAPRYPLAIGVTESKTEDAVYASVDNGAVTGFSRTNWSPFEWANVVWARPGTFFEGRGAVFETLAAHLPAPALVVTSFEVDNETDLRRARVAVESASVE